MKKSIQGTQNKIWFNIDEQNFEPVKNKKPKYYPNIHNIV